MPPEPLVSVIIPCYNQGRFVGEAIASALDQRPGEAARVEVIVVDDGSTDDTAEVAARYPVTLVRQANAGLAAARNAGTRASRGRFLVYLDADDRLLPGAVRAGLDCFASHPEAAFVSGLHRRVSADGAPAPTPDLPRVTADHYLALLRGNYVGMHAAVMYRREAVLEAGGFDPALPACEDYDLYLRIARARPVAQHDALVAEYRRHGANMSRDLGLMLGTVRRVLRGQAAHARGDPARGAALREGLRAWRAYYGDEMAREVVRGIRGGASRAEAARAAAALVRHAPGHAARRAARALYRRLARTAGRGRRVPPPGQIDLGDLRRTAPISPVFGFDRGVPVDRYYIERFLARHAADVRGRVLEVGDDAYTRAFGGDRVTRRDVLHVAPGNPAATLVADLARGEGLPSEAFDCVILTQTLHLIYELRAAVATLYRILRPGGVVLATVPGVSQIERGQWGGRWCWSLTTLSARRLFEEAFPPSGVAVEAHGNVLAAVAFLHGLAAHELAPAELDAHDPHYQVLVAVRAAKGGSA